MALTPSFTASQDLSNPNLITLTDTSTGSDSIVERHVFIQLWDGSYLVPAGTDTNYVVWDYANPSITLDVLTKSQAVTVTVQWFVNVNSNPSYTVVEEFAWDLHDYLFLFELLQTQTSNPFIINNSEFYGVSLNMVVNLFQAENAINKMTDVYSSQAALDRNLQYIKSENIFA